MELALIISLAVAILIMVTSIFFVARPRAVRSEEVRRKGQRISFVLYALASFAWFVVAVMEWMLTHVATGVVTYFMLGVVNMVLCLQIRKQK